MLRALFLWSGSSLQSQTNFAILSWDLNSKLRFETSPTCCVFLSALLPAYWSQSYTQPAISKKEAENLRMSRISSLVFCSHEVLGFNSIFNVTLQSEFIWMRLNSFTIYWFMWWTNAFYTLRTHILTSHFIAVKIEEKKKPNNFRLPFWKMKLELSCESLPVRYDHVFTVSASRNVRKVWTGIDFRETFCVATL